MSTALIVAVVILVVVLVLVLVLAASAIRIVREYERVVVFRLGRLRGARGPGLVLIISLIERTRGVNLPVETADIPPQDLITKDNVTGPRRGGVLPRGRSGQGGGRDPRLSARRAAHRPDDAEGDARPARPRRSARQLGHNQRTAQGDHRLRHRTLGSVVKVETKGVDLPESIKRAMARQAEAER